ncbi:MAG: S8 family serine peptidase, partial [Elainellaceae cyanobacterium]
MGADQSGLGIAQRVSLAEVERSPPQVESLPAKIAISQAGEKEMSATNTTTQFNLLDEVEPALGTEWLSLETVGLETVGDGWGQPLFDAATPPFETITFAADLDSSLHRPAGMGQEGDRHEFSAIDGIGSDGTGISSASTAPLTASAALSLSTNSVQVKPTATGSNAAFNLMGLTQMRNDSRFAGIDGSGFSVAVIDTGLDRYHPLLESAYVAGYDFVSGTATSVDRIQHGTHVSGIVGARDANVGVAPDVDLIGLQVFQNGYASNSRIEDALEWVLDNHERYNITAVNMSLGGGFYRSNNQALFSILADDIDRLEAAGITIVSAAGNAYKNNEYQNLAEPAIYSTLAVGAVWQDGSAPSAQFGSGAVDYSTGRDRIASFSQRLNSPNMLFAPGAFINSTIPGGGLTKMAGTSMASPMVAGAVALLQEAAMTFGGRTLTPDEIVDLLRSTGDRIFDGDDEDDNVRNTNVSYPRINIYAAVEEIYTQFRSIGGGSATGDVNGTRDGAIRFTNLAATLDGSIGIDGTSTAIGNTDVDLYRFTLDSASAVAVTVGSHSSQKADFDSYLRLFNNAGQELLSDDNSGRDNFSQLTANLVSGTYYVGVSGQGNVTYDPNQANSGVAGATGNYSLQLQLDPADADGLLSGATAVNVGTERTPFTAQGQIGKDGSQTVAIADVDMFTVYAPDMGQLLIDIDTPFSDGSEVDAYVRVFDAQGRELAFNDNALARNAQSQAVEFADGDRTYTTPNDASTFSGHTSDSFVAMQVEAGQAYTVAVSGQSNSSYNPKTLNNRSESPVDAGRYELAIAFASRDQNGSIDQAQTLPNLPLTAALQFGAIGIDSGVQVGNRDVDFFQVSPATDGVLDIDINSRVGTTLADPVDTVAYLFDGAGNLLGTNDDRDGADPRLQVQVQADTNYYVAIAGYGNSGFDPFQAASGTAGDTGDYFLSAQLLSAAEALAQTDNIISANGIQSVAIGSVVEGHIGDDNGFTQGATDVDLYRFVPDTSGVVSIRTLATEAFTADTYLRVFDADGVELAANDDENPVTRGSAVQLTVNANSTYFIGISGDGLDGDGSGTHF